MCEILCINYDKIGSTQEKDDMCYKRGMAIIVRDDGWEWNETELSSSYNIIKLPGISETHAAMLALEVPETTGTGKDEIPIKRRQKKIDLAAVTSDDRDYMLNEGNSITNRLARLASRTVTISS